MTIIDRYIFRQIWVPALLAAIVITLVLVGGAVQKQVMLLLNELPIAQFTLVDIGRISLYAVPNLVGYIIPITFLLGIMLAFGRMAQSNELTALKAAGIPLKRLVLPIVAAGGLLSAVTFAVFDVGQPWALRRLHDMQLDMLVRLTLDALPTGAMHQYGDWRVYIGRKEADGALRNIVVYVPRGHGKALTYYADSAQIEKEGGQSVLILRKGHFISAGNNETEARATFPELNIAIPKLSLDVDTSDEANSVAQLFKLQQQKQADLDNRQSLMGIKELRSYRVALSERLSFPLMCLAVSIVAAPIGARTRRSGRSFTFASGFLIVVVYFVLRKALQPAYLPELWQYIVMAQVPNLLLVSVGLGLLWRVDRT